MPNQDDQQLNNVQGQDQNEQMNNADHISAPGGPEAAPETAPAGAKEATQTAETGYEQIRQMEKSAEQAVEQSKEKTIEKAPQKQIPPKQSGDKREKKEVPKAVQPKFFGYRPPSKLATNVKYIKSNAGKGNKNESKTWLLIFLDRLLKKEQV